MLVARARAGRRAQGAGRRGEEGRRGVVDDGDAPSGKGRGDVAATSTSRARRCELDAAAAQRSSTEHLGEDLGRLARPARGARPPPTAPGARLGADDVEPFLGEAGGVPPWELTDAIDRGDTAVALDRLHRMLGAGDRHPLQVMATLHGHYARHAAPRRRRRCATRQAAAEVLGLKGSTFPARKALDAGRPARVATGIAEAIGLLAEADLDLRGAQGVARASW